MKGVQGKTKSNKIIDLINPSDGCSVQRPGEKADMLNSFFASQTELVEKSASTLDMSSIPANTEAFHTMCCTAHDNYKVGLQRTLKEANEHS